MRSARAGGLIVATVVAAAVACSDSGGPSGGLTGSYVLDTLRVDANPALDTSLATGTLVFSAPASFVVGLTLKPPAVPGPGDSTIALSGTYTLVPTDSIYLNVGGFFTIPGTYAEAGNQLVLDILVPAGLIGSGTNPASVYMVWHK